MYKIVLGSESSVKLFAVKKIYPNANIVCVPNLKSCVPEQPVGTHETATGAIYRKNKAKEFDWTADIWIGIESGMIEKRGKWFDRAYISIETKTGWECICWSEDLPIPEPVVIKPLMPLWSKLKDPHVELTNNRKSRADFIVDAIKRHIHEFDP